MHLGVLRVLLGRIFVSSAPRATERTVKTYKNPKKPKRTKKKR